MDGARLCAVSSMEGATADSVVFAMDAETLAKALESKAGVILASRKLECDGAVAGCAGVVGGGCAVCVCGGGAAA